MGHENMIPMNALRAFDAVARHRNFSRAAEELHVTQGAISRQIANLETCLGHTLFRRANRSVDLTHKGRQLQTVLAEPFRRIRAGLNSFLGDGNTRTLKVKLPPTLGVRWFIPRLGKFHGLHPEIDVQITTSHHGVDFEHEDVDVAIYWGNGRWAGLASDFLIGEDLMFVCSPDLLKAKPVRSIDDLQAHVLLQSMHRTDDSKIWMQHTGNSEPAWCRVLKFENSSLTYQAAIDQLGVVVAQSSFIQDDLAANRLVRIFDQSAPGENAYYLVYPEGRQDERKVALFRSWLLAGSTASVEEKLP